ncbi:PTS sugar transporter subunit IIA [Amycolatopsis suaedae]|uniref:Mannitol-specific phosphotransferase enzyme IIA component n=1 Tax=Amycolatopsis suaedae TaxID=2510978 RepID=A0A4Q7IY61_9PSEU|nr:PTS sugar transporter subunit IIA [Amycolatopsis suaedae]RZQ59901.1 PTS sugar transporter subunit IIA [Amycolatopsis suaedae]
MTDLLPDGAIKLAQRAENKTDAIRQVGATLVEVGAVEPEYVEAMLEREEMVSTFVGEGVSIPHGTDASRAHVKRTALAVLQFPDGVDWNGNDVRLCVGIAAKGSEQVGILSSLAQVLLDADAAARLRGADSPETIVGILQSMDEETVQ